MTQNYNANSHFGKSLKRKIYVYFIIYNYIIVLNVINIALHFYGKLYPVKFKVIKIENNNNQS